MIARIWEGRTRAADADEYVSYLEGTGFADYRSTPGNHGVLALRRIDGDEATFTVITLWRDLDAIRAFAGDDVEVARYYPEDTRYLLAMPRTVAHHEVVHAHGVGPGGDADIIGGGSGA